MIWYSNICIFIKLIFLLDFIETRPSTFSNNFNTITRKPIGFHFGFACFSADQTCSSIPFNKILIHDDFAILKEHHSVAFVFGDIVVFKIYDWSYTKYSIVITMDVVFGN